MNGLKKIISVSIVLLMIVCSFSIIGVGGTSPSHTSVATPTIINKEVLNVPLDSWDSVNSAIWLAHNLEAGSNGTSPYESNHSIGYDHVYDAAKLTASNNVSGCYGIGGATPSLESTINISVKIPGMGFNGPSINFQWFGWWVSVVSYQTDYGFYVVFYNQTGVIKTRSVISPIWTPATMHWIKISINWHSNRTYNVKFVDDQDGTVYMNVWNMTFQNYPFDQQPVMSPAWWYVSFDPGNLATNETFYSAYLRDFTQTIPVTVDSIYADVPSCKYSGFGMDAIYQPEWDNATTILDTHNASATFFIDYAYRWNGTPPNNDWSIPDIANWTNAGYEFGIHTTTAATYSAAERAKIASEFAFVLGAANSVGWGDKSFVWTSFGNDYSYKYADDNYVNNSAIGRKFLAHTFTNGGGLSWGGEMRNMTIRPNDRGIPWCVYTHMVSDTFTGGKVSDVTLANFSSLLNTTYDNGLRVVGMMEYFSRYCAPASVTGTINSPNAWSTKISIDYADLDPHNAVEITVNITDAGFKTNQDLIVTDPNGTDVPYVMNGDLMILNMTEGTVYTIVEPTSQAFSLLVGVIVVMAVLTMVMTVAMKKK